jgi:predicted acylesterase/phospholipase RssA
MANAEATNLKKRIMGWFMNRQPAAAPEPPPPVKLGKDGTLQVLSFSSGEFDGIMYLGLIHAMLFSKRKPDIIAGISSGAVAAVMAAEVFQIESNGAPSIAQIARFRELLAISRDLPNHLMRDLLPPLLQLDSPAPLEPLRSPVLAEEERAERLRAVQSRHGLLLLYNSVLGSRLKISTLTRLVRRALELRLIGSWQAKWVWRLLDWSKEKAPKYSRWKVCVGRVADVFGRCVLWAYTLTQLWLESFWPMIVDAGLVSKALWATALGWHVSKMRDEEGKAAEDRSLAYWIRQALFFRRNPQNAKGLLFRKFSPISIALKPVQFVAKYVIAVLVWLAVNPLTLLALVTSWFWLRFNVIQHGFWGRAWDATTFLTVLFIAISYGGCRNAVQSFFAYFDLKADLATSYVARLLYVKAFDPQYFGETKLTDMLRAALRGDHSAKSDGSANRKTLNHYLFTKTAEQKLEPRKHPILVMPVAANVGSGEIEATNPQESVVDALCAATALVPLFRAQPLQHGDAPKWDGMSWFIDGSNVAQEPLLPVLNTLKKLQAKAVPGISIEDIRKIEIITVSPDPIEQALSRERDQQWRDSFGNGDANPDSEEIKAEDHAQLLNSLPTVFGLQRIQAAKDERMLVQVYGRALKSSPTPFVRIPGADGKTQTCVAAEIHAIEPEEPLRVSAQLIQAANADESRTIIGKVIADGCRVTIQKLYENELRNHPKSNGGDDTVPCTEFFKNLGQQGLPGSRPQDGPGLAEVCKYCSKKLLRPAAKPEAIAPTSTTQVSIKPADTKDKEQDSKPLVSVVFAGGVFRGVFQVGVINALSQAGLTPNLVAGASVGTIMSAMAATTLAKRPGWTEENRDERVRSVAATFLAIDRLILTDRFADLIRNVTLRFGKADFSLRDADTAFRQFDRQTWGSYSKSVRQVLAGLEQMFFLDGKELLDLTISARERKHKRVIHLMRDYGQEFLDRSDVGAEILGAEPLELLIRHHVLGPLGLDLHQSSQFNVFKQFGVDFLATVTNVTTRQLDILSSMSPQHRQPNLLDGLLASSAFPAVFRPRWAWEIRPTDPWQLCIDGGVLDNLPLIPTARFLFYLISKGLAKPAPSLPNTQWSMESAVPHLIFTASLEVPPANLAGAKQQQALGDTVNSWMHLRERAGRLRHNKKVDRFIEFLNDVRGLRAISTEKDFQIPDMHAVCVKPQWLCGTFAFHPMLGFKKIQQARSIAHGCASTFAQMHVEEKRFGAQRTRYWWKKLDINEDTIVPQDPDEYGERSKLPPALKPALPSQLRKPGNCWFRNDSPCPFSPQQLEIAARRGESLPAPVFRDLASIYWECGKATTHQRRD